MKQNKENHIVSVIIPTIGRKTLKYTMEAIERQTRGPDEIIILIDKDRKGVSWARNQGIDRAKGDLIAFIDDDCVPDGDWLERLITALDKYNSDVAGGSYHETDSLLADARKRRKFPQKEQIDCDGFAGVGGNVIYKRSLLDKLKKNDGYIFNEKFSANSGEDHELIMRLKKNNATFVFVPSNPKHLKRINFYNYQKFQFYRGIGIADLYLSYSSDRSRSPSQKSLLWDKKSNFIQKALGILWYKIL